MTVAELISEADGRRDALAGRLFEAATGILAVVDPGADAFTRRYTIPDGHREVLLEAFRSGAGIPYPDYGADTIEGIAEMNRPMFLNLLGTDWLPAVPEIHERLLADPPARVADVGFGTGRSSIAIARAYPKARVDGFDVDASSIDLARTNAARAGVADRVTFHLHDAAGPLPAGRYDLVIAFETVHDMARPVEALRAMRGMVAAGGAVIVADERVGEEFSAPGDDIERLNYGFSVLHCLPVGLAETPSAGTGTVMRPPTLGRYAAEAGFRGVEILPIENGFWRFYRLGL